MHANPKREQVMKLYVECLDNPKRETVECTVEIHRGAQRIYIASVTLDRETAKTVAQALTDCLGCTRRNGSALK